MTACALTAAAQDPKTSYPLESGQRSSIRHPGAPDNRGRPNTDPPGRVARIQYMAGQVSIQPGGVNDWVAADLNRPSDHFRPDVDRRQFQG